MSDPNLPDFTKDQWEFLASMAALEKPVPMEILGTAAPLSPGPLFDLLKRCEKMNWLVQNEEALFSLGSGLPKQIRLHLRSINTLTRLEKIIDALDQSGLLDRIDPEVLARLMKQAGRYSRCIRLLIDLASASGQKAEGTGWVAYIDEAVNAFECLAETSDLSEWPLFDLIALSNHCFTVGQHLHRIAPILNKAIEVSRQRGDQRIESLIQLHLGRLYYVGDRRNEAFAMLASGKEKVEELGDDDILNQSLEFIGLFYYMQGLFAKAIEYFERAVELSETQVQIPYHIATIFLGYAAAYTGQFHRAIGSLDSNWQMARKNNHYVMAGLLQACLGNVLILTNKKAEALLHLENAMAEALSLGSGWALYFAQFGFAYYHFVNGDLDKALDTLVQYRQTTEMTGIVRQYSSPFVLELFDGLERAGYEMEPEWSFSHLYERAMQDPSIHLRGVALRLKAAREIAAGVTGPTVANLLRQSEECLVRSGSPVELAKTHLEMARLELNNGEIEAARALAGKARMGLPIASDDQFPDGMRFLLEDPLPVPRSGDISVQTLERSLQIIEELIPRPNSGQFLKLLVSAMNRLFKAERCGLFSFGSPKSAAPYLRSACNLFQSDVESEGFQHNTALIIKAFREGRPIMEALDVEGSPESQSRKCAVLCIPYVLRERTRGVLYLDNSYLSHCFGTIDENFLNHLSTYLGACLERIEEYGQFVEKARKMTEERLSRFESVTQGDDEMFTRNPAMQRLLTQADRMARSGATVLITGETGVGKEVMARWIHRKSHRSEGSLVVIDSTTIPENLVESELFGYEKGAFTGAGARKAGRLELAHNGTLFIDEIGEIPESIQVKLLRVLQEKTFHRVGGTKKIESDFRLLAATNRNLEDEVAKGKFRKDLYYRLNVMELRIPPLRERKEDIVPLTRHFISRYTQKYSRPPIRLNPEDQTLLKDYHWPGNIRELKNVIERAVLMSEGDRMLLNLPDIRTGSSANPFDDMPTFEDLQRRYIEFVLNLTNRRVQEAARLLGMKRTTLYSKMKKLKMI